MTKSQLQSVGLASLTVFAFLANAVVITLVVAPWLYGVFLHLGWIPLPNGLSAQAVQSDFQRVWTYLWQPWQSALDLQFFRSSAGGRQHFAEVKQLLLTVCLLVPLATGALWWGVTRLRGLTWHYARALNRAQWVMVALGVAVVVAFDRVFVLFHQLVFANDLWLFDPRLDPIIWVLPASYFMGLAVTVLLVYVMQSIWLWRKLFPKT